MSARFSRAAARIGAGLGVLAVSVPAAMAAGGADELTRLSLEELTQIEVYSASRHLEPTHGVPSAIFVLTGEDLRRSGVTNLPDALRLVPGVQVGRVDANKWAVSMRGFNSREANKLLVLVDGRSIYDPLFSGMLWEAHDFVLHDIERIEVIRGPGGTLWGANAFNGVLNIVTRHSRDTAGALLSLGAGDEERYIATLRYGWELSETQSARVYVKARERDTGFSEPERPFDASRGVRGGFRWDWNGGGGSELAVSGVLYDSTSGIRENPALVQNVTHRGRNLLMRWGRRLSADDRLQLQAYYDHVDYDSSSFVQERDTFDLELQQSVQAGARHLLVWGAGYRRMQDHALSALTGFVDVLPARRRDEILTAFAQDTFTVVPDTLRLVLGLKYERTDYADDEWLPNVRLAWTPRSDQTWWLAASRATRVPSRLEADLTFLGTVRIGDEMQAENVRAYEAGVRQLVSPRLWYDVALFYNDYDDLRTAEADGRLRNLMRGRTRGAELALRWEPSAARRFDLAYTYLSMDLALDPASTAAPGLVAFTEGLVSRHQVAARAMLALARRVDLDATVRYVDELTAIAVPAYTQLDLALTWKPRRELQVSLVGQNLLDAHQPEQDFAFSASGMPTQVQRGGYVRITWHW